MNLENLITSLENASDDNKKFALLLILSELLKSNKANEFLKTDKELNRRLFNSIDPHFLARLITTKQVVENSPILYKQAGLSILTQFLDFPELVTDPVLLTKIDAIFEILKSDLDQNSTQLKLDAFKYIYKLSEICPEFLYQNGLVDILISILLNEKYSSESLKVVYNFDGEDENNLCIISCKVLSNLFKDIVNDKLTDDEFPLSKTNEKIEQSFKIFFDKITSNQTEFKFKLINYLNFFLTNEWIKNYILMNENLNELTTRSVLCILNDVFKSKIKQSILEIGFVLVNNFINMFDFELIYMKDRNFFFLLIHLLCIQISVNLQQSYDLVVSDDLLNKMSIYYSLMEQVIIILSTSSPFDTGEESGDESDFSDEEEKTTEPEFEKVIKIVVEALETISLFIKDNLVEDFTNLDKNLALLLVSSIRVLACWMSHESLLEEDILELMPKMIKFSEYLKTSELKLNVFKFLSSGLVRSLNDKKNIFDFKSQNSKLKTDMVKFEYETGELDEQIKSIESMLNTCNLNSV